MTAASLEKATGMSPEQAALWLPYVTESAERFDFAAPRRMAMWLSQVCDESDNFLRLRESLNYRASALRANWPKRFPSDEIANLYAHQQEKIANKVYGGRLGNGPEESGDGWRFRGRGLVQITGRANYKACGVALKVDLEEHPELLETHRLAALSAGWYWDVRKLNVPADKGDVDTVSRLVNGGHIGTEDRPARYRRALAALE